MLNLINKRRKEMKLRKLLAAVVAVSMLLPATVALAATPVYENGFEGTIGGATVVTRERRRRRTACYSQYTKGKSSISPQFAEGVNGQALYLDGNYGVVLDCEAVGDTYCCILGKSFQILNIWPYYPDWSGSA